MKEQTAVDRFIRNMVFKLISAGICLAAILIYLEVKEADREARDRKGREVRAYREEASDHSAAGRYAEAIVAYKKWIAIEPDEKDAYSYLAEAYSELGQHENAISTWEKCIAVEMKSLHGSDISIGSSYSCIGDAYVKLKKYAAAITAYEKDIALYPSPDNVDPYWKMAQAYEKLDQYPQAIATYRRLSSLKPIGLWSKDVVHDARKRFCVLSTTQPADRKALVLLHEAEDYYMQGQFPESLAACKKAVAIKPDFAEAHCAMGDALHCLKKYHDAVAAFKKAVAIRPDYALAYCCMGYSYSWLDQYPQALAACKKAVEIKPDKTAAHLNTGCRYDLLERYPNVITVRAYLGMGAAYSGLQKYRDAITVLKKAVAVRIDDARRANDFLDQYAEGIRETSYCQMGNSYAFLEQYPEAIAAYKKCIAIEPAGEIADAAREAISELSKRESYDKLNKQLTELEKSQGGGLKMKAGTQPADK